MRPFARSAEQVAAESYVEQELAEWRRLGVLGHHVAARPWIGYHEHAAAGLAALAGAGESEVVAMNSLTVNLHLMMVSFFRPGSGRNRVLIEKSAFPSDRYAIVSQLEFHGLNAAEHLIEVAPRPGERTLRTEDLIACLEREGPRLALVLLPGVQYLTGQLLELAPLIAAARAAGASVGLDLAHAVGNMPLAPARLERRFRGLVQLQIPERRSRRDRRLLRARASRASAAPAAIHGWWGHDKAARFEMGPQFTAHCGRGRLADQQSADPVDRSVAGLARAVPARGHGPAAAKNRMALTAFLQRLIERGLPHTVEIVTPAAAAGAAAS